MTFGVLRRPLAAVLVLGALAVAGAAPGGATPGAPTPSGADGRAGSRATLPAPGDPVTIQAGDRWFPRDEQGRAFVMHGYNIKLHGDRLDEVTPAVLSSLRANGFTVLRLATFWTDLEPTEGDWDESYLADLGRILQDADEVGLKIVLTMHQDSYSPAVGGYGMPDWTTRTDGLVYGGDALVPCLDPANQRAWEHFWEDEDLQQFHVRAWSKMVDELGDEPALYGYDLLNEPCGQPRDGEDLIAALQRVEATQITPMLQRVTDAIRERDTTRWIFLEGAYGLTSSLGGAHGLGAVDDPTGRQIFAPHIYDLAMETGADWNPASPFVANYYESIVSYGIEHEVPTVVFEWGPQRPALPNAEDYVHQVMQGADAHLAGWSAFAWCRALAGWCQLDSDGNPGAGMTDNVQVYPVQVAGRPLAIDGDHPAGRSAVTVDPVGADAEGPTTFFFPLRRFPTGPSVTVETGSPAPRGSSNGAGTRAPLPADQWSWSFDAATQTVSVEVDPAVAHTITVRPADDGPPTTTTTTTTASTSTSEPAGSTTTEPGADTSTTGGGPSSTVAPGTDTDGAGDGRTSPSGTGRTTGSLARTGDDPMPLIAAGLGLVGLGVAATAASRRRRSA
jgi:endoglycosylceramidase